MALIKMKLWPKISFKESNIKKSEDIIDVIINLNFIQIYKKKSIMKESKLIISFRESKI